MDRIIGLCGDAYPAEACGILAGSAGEAEKVYPVTNTSSDAVHCYFMDPAEQLKIFKQMRKDGMELAGIYHSHAHTGAYPSEKDISLAYYTGVSYVIVSFMDRGAPSLRSFRIEDGKVEEEKILSHKP